MKPQPRSFYRNTQPEVITREGDPRLQPLPINPVVEEIFQRNRANQQVTPIQPQARLTPVVVDKQAAPAVKKLQRALKEAQNVVNATLDEIDSWQAELVDLSAQHDAAYDYDLTIMLEGLIKDTKGRLNHAQTKTLPPQKDQVQRLEQNLHVAIQGPIVEQRFIEAVEARLAVEDRIRAHREEQAVLAKLEPETRNLLDGAERAAKAVIGDSEIQRIRAAVKAKHEQNRKTGAS